MQRNTCVIWDKNTGEPLYHAIVWQDTRTGDVAEKLKENGGYCPCSLLRNEDTKCMCKEFREMKQGECHCGLYIKVDDSQEG